MTQTLFRQKINYLFEKLGYSENEFTKLFKNQHTTSPSLGARKKAVIGNWLRKGVEHPNNFEFESYPISELNIDGVKAFSKEAFLQEDLESFQARVDAYIKNQVVMQREFEFNYRYIYYFDMYYQEIKFLTIEILESISTNKVKIKVLPPDSYNETYPYYGTLEIFHDYYYLSIQNDFEIISFYFAINKGFANKAYLHGMRLSLSYDVHLPIAGKMILTPKHLDSDEIDKSYLHLNENEYLMLDRYQNSRYTSLKTTFMHKVEHTIKNLTIFTKKMRKKFKDRLFDDVYFNVYYRSFLSRIINFKSNSLFCVKFF